MRYTVRGFGARSSLAFSKQFDQFGELRRCSAGSPLAIASATQRADVVF
jgi:hypothetical protein